MRVICSARRKEIKSAMAAVSLLLIAVSTEAFVNSQCKQISFGQNIIRSDPSYTVPNNLPSYRRHCRSPSNVVLRTATSDTEMEAEISKMRVKEIRDELESYGINTKSFLEKSELAEALLAARKEGKTPIKDVSGASTTSSSSSSGASSSKESKSSSAGNRQERLVKEMEKCKSMKVADLKKELESYGLSTKSYFEKSEFVRAVAEARVDGVKKQPEGSSSRGQQNDEPYDPSYRDVVVSKFSGDSKLALGGTVIDVKAR